jgi:hypothetical protein
MNDEPSRFWEQLAGEHRADLNRFGFESVKRRQALRYFTWQWRWRRIASSEQMRFLLANTPPGTWLRCACTPARLGGTAWDGVPWSRADRWLYVLAVRLLWEYAAPHDRWGVLRLPEPDLGAPFPVYWRGRLISQDLANSALEMAAVARAIGARRPRSAVEIGAGYGRTAYVLASLFPELA